MADAALDLRVAPVELRAEFGCPAQVPRRGENAERAAASRQMAVDPVRGLARGADDAEHILGGKIEDRQPVEDLAPGDAQALVAAPGDTFGAGGAFVAAEPEAVDEPAAEARVGFEIAAEFAFDGPALMRGGTPALTNSGELAALFHMVEQRLAGRNRRHDERHAGGKRRLDMGDDALPFDFAERGVDGDELVARNDAGEQDRHRLRILAARVRDCDEGAGPDHLPALRRNADFGDAAGHGSVSPAVAREAALRPPNAPRRGRPLPPAGATWPGSRGSSDEEMLRRDGVATGDGAFRAAGSRGVGDGCEARRPNANCRSRAAGGYGRKRGETRLRRKGCRRCGDGVPVDAGQRELETVMDAKERRKVPAFVRILALMCVRQSMLETLHRGLTPVTRTGDYSDVVVVDAEGQRIPWPEVSRFHCADYPHTAASAQPWDIENDSGLPAEKWPTGRDRVSLAFNPGWKGGTCLYLPCDRQSIEGHENWRNDHPALLWDPKKGICKYLGIIHEMLNSNDYGGRRGS